MRSITIPKYIQRFRNADKNSGALLEETRIAYSRLRKEGAPEVSIVMPAYNEEDNIVQTLGSLCNNDTKRSVEIIVVNNNSTDNTEGLVKACGVSCVLQTIQGITPSRNLGLSKARGKYILNADADTIYPKGWIEEMVSPLANDNNVAVTYGQFSFIPIGVTGRVTYFIYEHLADCARFLDRLTKDEAVCVYGFNSGFRREQGLEVDSFNHPPGTNEDGWLALKLRNKGFGRLHYVTKKNAIAWTTDRRIQIDGGLWKGTVKRLKRVLIKK